MQPEDPTNKKRPSEDKEKIPEKPSTLKDHPGVQFFIKIGYSVWIIVMVVGVALAFLFSLLLL